MRTYFRLHGLTHLVLGVLIALAVWLNFDYSRQAYTLKAQQAWHGGMSMGFPLTWWHSGYSVQVRFSTEGREPQFHWRKYGGWCWPGALGDVLVLLAALATTAIGCESLVRRKRALRPRPAPMRQLSRQSVLVAVMTLTALIALNLSVTTSLAEEAGQVSDASQCMGWPLTTYSASRPQLEAWLSVQAPLPSRAEVLLYLEHNTELHWLLSHWHLENIGLNILIGVLLSCAAAAGSDRLVKRLSNRQAEAGALLQPVRPNPNNS